MMRLIRILIDKLTKKVRLGMPSLAITPVVCSVVAVFMVAGGVYALQSNEPTVPEPTKTEQSRPDKKPVAEAGDVKGAATESAVLPAPPATTPTPAPRASTPQSNPVPSKPAASQPKPPATQPAPPTPQPVSITIMRPNQVAPGTLIYDLPVKKEKGYYGGDLISSISTVTYSKAAAGPRYTPVVISTPDGSVVARPPSDVYYDRRNFAGIAIPGTTIPGPNSSFNLRVEIWGDPPIGTHTLHFSISRDNPQGNAIEYHGFITINIVP